MKKLVITLIFAISAKILLAQYDPKALEVLEAMSKKYKAVPAFEANISYTLTNEVEKINEEFKEIGRAHV